MRYQIGGLGRAIAQGTAVAFGLAIGLADAGLAQIVPDGTLGAEGSRVTPNVLIRGGAADRIEGGAVRGANLFHSFQEFNIGNGQRVYFANPAEVRNILTRVTGNNLSNIQGTLGVEGVANLFLMNPNGLVFGQNARLDVSGSFVGTTASRFTFADGFAFSASDPQAIPLLTVSAPIGLQMGAAPGRIINQAGDADGFFALTVDPGRTLALIGGDIILDGGNIFTTTGQILLEAVGGGATVGLDDSNSQVAIKVPANAPLSNLFITNGSAIYTFGGGSIQLWGRQIALDNAALIFSQNGGDLTVRTAQLSLDRRSFLGTFTQTAANSGTIDIQASDSVEVANQSQIFSSSRGATGNSGNIFINTRNLMLRDNGLISSITSGAGNSGNISLKIGTLSLRDRAAIQTGTTAIGNSGSISVQAQNAITLADSYLSTATLNLNSNRSSTLAFGRAGDITLDTQRLQLTKGSSVISRTNTSGNAGNIQVRATEAIEVEGASSNATSSLSSTTSGFQGTNLSTNTTGNSGNLSIATGRLAVTNGGNISTQSVRSRGNAGQIEIQAREVEVTGFTSSDAGVNISSINAQVTNNDTAVQGGDIAIDTDRLTLKNGGNVSTNVQNGRGVAGDIRIRAVGTIDISGIATRPNNPAGVFATLQTGGIGSGGNIQLMTHRLNLSDRGQISTGTFSQGDAGNVSIDATQVDLSNLAGINTQVNSGATGNAGDLEIKTQQLRVQSDAQISTTTSGSGNAGSLTIQANQIELDNRLDLEGIDTGFFTTVNAGATGNAGTFAINTDRLALRNGAVILANTDGNGQGGDLQIRAADQVLLANSSIGSGVFAKGQGDSGNLTLVTPRLILQNASGILATTNGQGNAGNVTIRARDLVAEGGSTINTSTSGQGNAGSLFITVANSIVLAGVNPLDGNSFSGFATVVSPGSKGTAGNIQVQTNRLIIRDGATISASTKGQGRAGDIRIDADESVRIAGASPNDQLSSGIFTRTLDNAQGRSGNITLTTPSLQVTQNGTISAETQTDFQGGNIILNADRILLADGGQAITTTSRGGQAGNITITADRITLSGRNSNLPQLQRQMLSQTGNTGQAESGLFANTDRTSTGRAGNINISTRQLSIQNNAEVAINSQGTGQAGRLDITARNVSLDRGTITANTVSSRGGKIDLAIADSLQLRNRSQIAASTQSGQGGRLSLNSDRPPTQLVELSGNSQITTAASRAAGTAGNLNLNTESLNVRNSNVTVSNLNGRAGNLAITANSILLDNGNLTAQTGETQGTSGANIRLQDLDLLLLRNGSQIDANAGDRAKGGNITIDSQFIVAVPSEDSNIRANAVRGQGGNVQITTAGLFGIQPATAPIAGVSDITASSEQGVQGSVTINQPNVDPSRGLTELPTVPTDAAQQIAAACPTSAEEADRLGSFIVSGRGGLPPSPIDLLSDDNVLSEWVTPSPEAAHAQVAPVSSEKAGAIVEAEGIGRSPEGKVMLIAPAATLPSQQPSTICQSKS